MFLVNTVEKRGTFNIILKETICSVTGKMLHGSERRAKEIETAKEMVD